MNPVESLRSVLCDPEGNVVIRGSDGDREVIRQALEALAEQPAEAAGDGRWNLIEQCAICHGSGYKPGVNGPRPCLNCDGEGSRSPSPAASVDVEGLRERAERLEAALRYAIDNPSFDSATFDSIARAALADGDSASA